LHLVFLWLDQEFHELIESGIRASVYFFHLYRADRVLDDKHWVIRRAKCLFL
jgi:hypothetical protein